MRIQFNNDGTFTSEKIADMSYSAAFVGTVLLDGLEEQLFICGGDDSRKNVGSIKKNAEIHNLCTDTITTLKEMNHRHDCPGVCTWNDNGRKVVVAGGWKPFDPEFKDGNHYVEQYDIEKDVWI